MIPETYAPRIILEPLRMPFAVTPTHRNGRVHEAYGARSSRNIASWREFLPEECVKAMIRMGWDRTT
jgi:hypothetical protein